MGTIMLNGESYGGGGGTNVVANPSGQATDDLEKIQIGNIIYEIPSGGSNTEYTVLYSGDTEETEYQLSDSVYNYDYLIINGAFKMPDYWFYTTDTVDVALLSQQTSAKPYYFGFFTDSNYVCYKLKNPSYSGGDGDVIDKYSSSIASLISSVIGVKLNSGSGGGGASKIDLLWDSGSRSTGATVGQTYNFAHPLSDYDEIVTITRQLGDVGGTYDHTCYNNILVSDILNETNKNVLVTNYQTRHIYLLLTSTTFNVWESNECALCKVYGIKYGGGGGGGGIDYSTTEQDTGIKWIDGRSIYQKTYHLTNQQRGNITIDLGLGENAVDLFIDKKFILLRPDGKIAVNNCNITDWGQDFTQSYVFGVDSTTHNWQLIIQTGYYDPSDVYLTIQYVKASS